MRTETIARIEELINSEIERELLQAEKRITNAILDRVDRRATVIYEPTGNNLFMSLTGDKFKRAYYLRQKLYYKNNEDFRIIKLIGEVTDRK